MSLYGCYGCSCCVLAPVARNVALVRPSMHAFGPQDDIGNLVTISLNTAYKVLTEVYISHACRVYDIAAYLRKRSCSVLILYIPRADT